MKLLRLLDDAGNVIDEMDYDASLMCYGSRSGATSEMCGGCCHCIALQLTYYGTPHEIVDDYQ
jgi:hypothetical protein